jgi:hypothetical protein
MIPGDLARIDHALPHRVRLVSKVLAGRPDVCERVAHAFAATDGFTRITVRPLTGSVLIEDDEATLDPGALLEQLRALIESERDEEGRPVGALGPEPRPGPTRIARAVVRAAVGINADVRERLGQRADLGTLLPVFFAAAGVTELGATGKMPVPSWFNLRWWSMRAFMTFNLDAVEEAEDGGEHPREREIVDAL